MNFKFVPNLFLEVVELSKFKQSLDENGFRKNILENTESFGLIQNRKSDSTFLNGRVLRDVDNTIGEKTVKISPLFAIDMNGQFIYQEQKNQITIPSNGVWHWIRVKHTFSNIEEGKFSISPNGNLTGSITSKLTEIFRGQPNFPTRIRFTNSAHNTLEYDVLEVIDNQNAILQHPALTQLGEAAFIAEENLLLEIIGTFTPGIAVPNIDKRPFQYDSCVLQLIPETTGNTRPTYTEGVEFYLARVKVEGGDLIVQDKRTNFWNTKGSQAVLNINRNNNNLIGVEAVRWDSPLTPSDSNIVELAWGMRTQNWSIDPSQNVVTFQGSAMGGRYKTIENFTNGDFNGWRVYSDNGKYSRIINSVKQGLAINLTLDTLDVDNYSNDGGLSFTATNWLLAVPDADTIIIKCTPDALDEQKISNVETTFPINTLVARLKLTVYKDPSCKYNIQYRYKSYKEFTRFKPIPSDPDVGYYTESSFNTNGDLKPFEDRVKQTYILDPLAGFIKLNMSSNAYSKTISFINKGDLIGVNTIVSILDSLYEIKVGVSKNYQHIVGNHSLDSDVRYNLSKVNAIEGNEFRFHIDCTSLTLGTKNIFFSQVGASQEAENIIKKIGQADVNQMLNQEGGITLDFVFDGSSWIMYQNYSLRPSGEILTLDGVVADMFNSNGWGRIKGLYGVALCDGRNGAPDLVEKFIYGAGTHIVDLAPVTVGVGDYGGTKTHTLSTQEMPSHRHKYSDDANGLELKQANDIRLVNPPVGGDMSGDGVGVGYIYESSAVGGGQPHNNMPPYYALIYAKRIN